MRTVLDGWLAYAYENQQRWRMLFRDQGGDEEVQRARAEVHERAREVLASFLGRVSRVRDPARPGRGHRRALEPRLAAMVLWWSEHPDVQRSTLVDVATRAVTGLGAK